MNTNSLAKLKAAATKIFNTSYLRMDDPGDTLWKGDIRSELEILVNGGVDSVSVIENLLLQCANGDGGSISEEWYNNGELVVKAAAVLPKKEAAAMLVRMLRKDSNIVEWFRNIQPEMARQLGKIGDSDTLSSLRAIVKQPLSMSPINAIAEAIEQLGGGTSQPGGDTSLPPSVLLAKVDNMRDYEEGVRLLLPYVEKVTSWGTRDKGFYFFLLGRNCKNLGYVGASCAFYAADIAVRPEPTTFGWHALSEAGILSSPVTPSQKLAQELHEKYPVPKTMDEIKSYPEIRSTARLNFFHRLWNRLFR